MSRVRSRLVCCSAIIVVCIGSSYALSQGRQQFSKQKDDITRDFIARMGKLALQYEKAGNYDEARDALDLLMKIDPDNTTAKSVLGRIEDRELSANKKTTKILANQGWQKSGIKVYKGRSIVLDVTGTWVFRMTRTVGPEGIQMPKEMQEFPLGSLIAVIQPTEPTQNKRKGRKNEETGPRPFRIPLGDIYTPDTTGILFLKMHDSKEADNSGQINVNFSGQFDNAP